jgi:peptidoglycan hydrolase-like protein with peptidoglycan-binding domain
MLTRARYAAYDPEVWTIQTYLSELGFDPGTIDGVWGDRTASAALVFRSWAGLPAASGLDKTSIVTEDFWTELDRATASAGFDINIGAPATAPGGSGVRVTPVSTSPGPAVSPTPAAPSSSASIVLPLALLGVGAYIAFGKGRR